VRRIKYGVYTGKRVWAVRSFSNIVVNSKVVAGGIVAKGIILDS
jgi:hypothetical protein